MHLNKRIAYAFFQLIVAYNTGYTFEIGKTKEQGYKGGTFDGVKYQGAHSATIPCLYANDLVYLFKSQYSNESNATITLPIQYNQADSEIDLSLRPKMLSLINRASRGDLTPQEGVKRFAKLLYQASNKASKRCTLPKKLDVLLEYADRTSIITSQLDDDYLDMLLCLNIQDPVVRKVSDLSSMSNDELLEVIKRKIQDVAIDIHPNTNGRQFNHFYNLYHLEVFKRFANRNLATIERSLQKNYGQLSSRALAFKNTRPTQQIMLENSDKIDRLSDTILPIVRKVQGRLSQPLPSIEFLGRTTLRQNVHKHRYDMIRQDQKTQSEILTKIQSVRNKIETKKFEKFYFYKTLIEAIPAQATRQKICKLTNHSESYIKQHVRELNVNANASIAFDREHSATEALITKIRHGEATAIDIEALFHRIESGTRTHKGLRALFYMRLYDQLPEDLVNPLINKTKAWVTIELERSRPKPKGVVKQKAAEIAVGRKADEIEALVQFIEEKISHLNKQTRKYQTDLFKTLRMASGMSQSIARETYQKGHISAGAMSNLETGKTQLDAKHIEGFAEVFFVDQSLFYPGHFAAEVA